jgi:hypothetical protein
VDLREPGKACPLIDQALSEINPRYVRDRTIYYVRSAEAYLYANELEMACDSLHTAADLAYQTAQCAPSRQSAVRAGRCRTMQLTLGSKR